MTWLNSHLSCLYVVYLLHSCRFGHCSLQQRSKSLCVIFKIFFTSKSFSRREVLELASCEYHPLITPTSHIFLPHRYFFRFSERVAVRLCISIYRTAYFVFSEIDEFLMPVVYSVKTLFKIITTSYHSVKEIFALETIGVYHFNGLLTVFYLCRGVTAKSYPTVQPFNSCDFPCKLVGHQPCIIRLV